jgi:hypothetical protein
MTAALPKWENVAADGSDPLWRCNDDEQMQFAIACELYGFDLPAHDLWIMDLPSAALKELCLQHRSRAHETLRTNNRSAAKLHLETLFFLKRLERREDYLLPLARRDAKRQKGVKLPRRPDIDHWIETQLSRLPDAKPSHLWQMAPETITDQIGYERFRMRVAKSKKSGRK